MVLLVMVVTAVAVFLAWAAAVPERSVLLDINPDPGMVRPRNYCVMNPFRDRAPERIAERFLSSLRKGDLSVLAIVDDPDRRLHCTQRETEYPVQQWRVGTRNDKPDGTELMYWVERGGGYGGEEEVHFAIVGKGDEAKVIAFSAVY